MHGYEGTSTRAIATEAGVGQPLLNYHFQNKDGVWRAAMDSLFEEIERFITDRVHGLRGVDDETVLKLIVQDFIVFSALHPQLHRIMIQENAIDGERAAWLDSVHVRPIYELVAGYIERLIDRGVLADIPALHFFYIIVGAGPTLFALAPECRRFTGVDPMSDSTIRAHADAVVDLLFAAPGPGAATN